MFNIFNTQEDMLRCLYISIYISSLYLFRTKYYIYQLIIYSICKYINKLTFEISLLKKILITIYV